MRPVHTFYRAETALRVYQGHRRPAFQARGLDQCQSPHLTEEPARVRARTDAPLAGVGMVTTWLGGGVEDGMNSADRHLKNAHRRTDVAQTVLQALERNPEALSTFNTPGIDKSQQPDPAGQRLAVQLLTARLHEREGWKYAEDLRQRRRSPQEPRHERPTGQDADCQHPEKRPSHQPGQCPLEGGRQRFGRDGGLLNLWREGRFSASGYSHRGALGASHFVKRGDLKVPGGTSLISKVPSFPVRTA